MNEQAAPDLPPTSPPRRKLHFVFAVDASGSMTGDRMASLNYAVRAAIPAMQEAAAENPEIDVLVRVLRFADTVDWPIPDPVPVQDLVWNDISAGGETNMGAAFTALAKAMSIEAMPGAQLPPVVVLLSDGLPTDDAEAGLAAFLACEYGRRAVRLAIAIGSEADSGLLQEFIADPKLKPLQANNAASLVNHVTWATSVPVKSASSPVGAAGTLQETAPAVAQQPAGAQDMVW